MPRSSRSRAGRPGSPRAGRGSRAAPARGTPRAARTRRRSRRRRCRRTGSRRIRGARTGRCRRRRASGGPDLAVLPERAAVHEEVQLVEQRHRVPVGSSGIVEVRRLPGLDRRTPGRRLGQRVAREVDGPRPAAAPCLRVPLPPLAARTELDDGQVPGDREPDGPPLAGASSTVAATAAPDGRSGCRPPSDGPAPGSSRPSSAKSAQSSRSATGSNVARADSSTPSASRAAIASVPRRAVGASSPAVSELDGQRPVPIHDAVRARRRRSGRRERVGPA